MSHIGDIRHTFGDGDPRQAGVITDLKRWEQEAVQAAIYRITDDWDQRWELMRMMFQPINEHQTSRDSHRYKGGKS